MWVNGATESIISDQGLSASHVTLISPNTAEIVSVAATIRKLYRNCADMCFCDHRVFSRDSLLSRVYLIRKNGGN